MVFQRDSTVKVTSEGDVVYCTYKVSLMSDSKQFCISY